MLTLFTSPEAWVALFTLTVLEIVLGIDNLLFISVIASRLPTRKQKPAWQIGLLLACVTRLLLLAAVSWMTHFIQPLFSMFGLEFSGRDLVLIGGGLFLLTKATSEIHLGVVQNNQSIKLKKSANFYGVLIQIMLLDIIFSIDSVITAVGMVGEYIIMALAIIIAILLMIIASGPLSRIIQQYPTLKMLGMSFLLLVGMVLVADGFSFYVPRGYLYFAIAFSLFVEIMNILAGRRKQKKSSGSH